MILLLKFRLDQAYLDLLEDMFIVFHLCVCEY